MIDTGPHKRPEHKIVEDAFIEEAAEAIVALQHAKRKPFDEEELMHVYEEVGDALKLAAQVLRHCVPEEKRAQYFKAMAEKSSNRGHPDSARLILGILEWIEAEESGDDKPPRAAVPLTVGADGLDEDGNYPS